MPDLRRRDATSRAAFTAVLAGGLIALASCGTNDNNQLGVALIEGQGELKAVRLVVVAAPDTTTDFHLAEIPPGTGTVGAFLVGTRPGYLARSLVRFDASAFPAAGTVVDSARIAFPYRQGLGATPPLALALHRVTSGWTENVTDPDSFPSFLATALETLMVPFPTDAIDTIEVALPGLAQFWVDAPDSNLGLALLPLDGNDVEIEFSSSESAEPPRFTVYWTESGAATSTALSPTDDVFFLEKDGFVPLTGTPGRLTIANGIPARSQLKFSWEDLGERATINRAELTMFVDAALSVTNGFSAGIQRILAEPWQADSTEVDPLLFGVTTVSAELDSVTFNVTPLIDRLSEGENHGMQLRALEERLDTDHVRFHGADTEVPGKSPSLRIWYTPGDVAEGS